MPRVFHMESIPVTSISLHYYYRKQEENSPGCDEVLEETFDAVMVCTGHHWDQAKPKIPGIERFEGAQIHSGDYRIFHPFVGKRVVAIGSANSAGLFKSNTHWRKFPKYVNETKYIKCFQNLLCKTEVALVDWDLDHNSTVLVNANAIFLDACFDGFLSNLADKANRIFLTRPQTFKIFLLSRIR